ncbi:MAG: RagB/SusD family nutrient uptake outer membrane protein [Tannerellaceae bacterium]|nr:RagB/SusD family nutrient uptake outer membrane protein [Tannerellaceae bacterium]
MKKIIFLPIIFLAVFTSCIDLDLEPKKELTESSVYSDKDLLEAFLNNQYWPLGHGFTGRELLLAGLCDEARFTHGWAEPIVTLEGNVTPTQLGGITRIRQYNWGSVFTGIRECNMILENTEPEVTTLTDQDFLDQIRGQAIFIRAYHYHNLIRIYGGVPIIERTFEIDEDFNLPRNTLKECVDFVVAECDRAAALLPAKWDAGNLGRATKGAALTLKSRILLYAASDLFNNTSAWASGYSNPELVGYTDNDCQARWQAAKQAAKDVIDLNQYSLYKANPAPGDSIAQNYHEIFITKDHEEIFCQKFFLAKDMIRVARWFGPNGYGGWGSDSPTQEIVDYFLMSDGSKFDWSNPAHAANPYANKDPRFRGSILHDGASFQPRIEATVAWDPVGIIKTAISIEYIDENGQKATRPGLDTRQGPFEDWNGAYTNYYINKFIDNNIAVSSDLQEIPWIHMRYAEVLLNYAEASIGAGDEASAITALNQLRKRAGMPDIPAGTTGTELLELCRNERIVELAFEEHRYFDARRWLTAEKDFSRKATGIDIVARLNPDNVTYTKTYTVPSSVTQNRNFKKQHYLTPIPDSEMKKSPLFIQNPGYTTE